jgi:hypothetical protein
MDTGLHLSRNTSYSITSASEIFYVQLRQAMVHLQTMPAVMTGLFHRFPIPLPQMKV